MEIFFGRNSNAGSGTKSDPYALFSSAASVADGDVIWAESGTVFSEQFPSLWVQRNNLRLDVWGGSERPVIDVATFRNDFTYDADHDVWVRQYGANTIGCVRMDGAALQFVEWNSDLQTTRGAMGEWSWAFDGINFTLYIVCRKAPSVLVAETLYAANLNYPRHDLHITGWAFKGAARHGIEHYSRTDSSFTDVEVAFCGGHYIGGSAKNLGNGIEMTDGCARIDIVRPFIHDIFDSGITPQLYDEGATVSDIRIRRGLFERCGQAGVEVSIQGGITAATVSRITVEENDCRHSGRGWSGIRYQGGWGYQVIANKTGAGFVVRDVGVFRNRAYNCTGAGIVLSRWHSSSLTVAGNEMDSCGQGIRTTYIAGESAGSVEISGNIARDCAIGYHIACDVAGTVIDLANNVAARCTTGASIENSAGTVNFRNGIIAECVTGMLKSGAGTLVKDKNTLWANGTNYSGATQGTDVFQDPMVTNKYYQTLRPGSPCAASGVDVGLRQGRRGLLQAPFPVGASEEIRESA